MKKPLIGISTLLFKDVTGATPTNPMTGRFFANRNARNKNNAIIKNGSEG